MIRIEKCVQGYWNTIYRDDNFNGWLNKWITYNIQTSLFYIKTDTKQDPLKKPRLFWVQCKKL